MDHLAWAYRCVRISEHPFKFLASAPWSSHTASVRSDRTVGKLKAHFSHSKCTTPIRCRRSAPPAPPTHAPPCQEKERGGRGESEEEEEEGEGKEEEERREGRKKAAAAGGEPSRKVAKRPSWRAQKRLSQNPNITPRDPPKPLQILHFNFFQLMEPLDRSPIPAFEQPQCLFSTLRCLISLSAAIPTGTLYCSPRGRNTSRLRHAPQHAQPPNSCGSHL